MALPPNYQLNSQENIKSLYDLGINFLKKQFNSGVAKTEFVVTHQKNANEIEVVYFGEKYGATNTNQIQRKFDSQFFDFWIGWSTNANSSPPTSSNPLGTEASSNFSFKIEKPQNLRKYTYYELDIYALGRMGNTWSGNRMIKTD